MSSDSSSPSLARSRWPLCVESLETTMTVAQEVKRVCDKLGLPFHVKASYRKANRSRLDSFSGIGDERALAVLADVKAKLGVGIVTDIHLPEEAEMAAQVADVLQIPAFLCRQTDLLGGRCPNGQNRQHQKRPVHGAFVDGPRGGQGAGIGQRPSVADRAWHDARLWGPDRGHARLAEMRAFAPTFMDLTHSLQQPNQASGVTGGRPELIATVARAAVAAGVDGVFIETHPDPSKALSDGANMLPLDQLEGLLTTLSSLHDWRQAHALTGTGEKGIASPKGSAGLFLDMAYLQSPTANHVLQNLTPCGLLIRCDLLFSSTTHQPECPSSGWMQMSYNPNRTTVRAC